MIKTDVKNALRNYESYKQAIIDEIDELIVIQAKEEKVSSSIIKLSETKSSRDSVLLNNLERKELILLSKAHHEYLVQIADDFLSYLKNDDRNLIIDVYKVKKISMETISQKYYRSIAQIYRDIDRIIEDFIKVYS